VRSRTLHYLGATLAVLILIAVIGSFVDQNVSAKVPVFEQASQCAETPTGTLTAPPLISVVGASFTAGVGPDNPSSNWAVRLAELLGWRGKTFGVPSVGYVNPGQDRLGPLDRLVSDLELASSHPKVVIVQAGHNDWRVPGTIERGRVEALVGLIEREDPGARLVFLTGFATLHSDRVNKRVSYTNDAIVEAIRSIDPKAIVIDPFSWRFQRSSDGLHPTALGDLQIAERVDGVLKADSVVTGATKPTAVDVSCKSLGKPRAFEEHLHGLGHRGPEPGPRWDSSQMTNDRATDTVTREAT
jgi:lysophospholipase L1-like esterase